MRTNSDRSRFDSKAFYRANSLYARFSWACACSIKMLFVPTRATRSRVKWNMDSLITGVTIWASRALK